MRKMSSFLTACTKVSWSLARRKMKSNKSQLLAPSCSATDPPRSSSQFMLAIYSKAKTTPVPLRSFASHLSKLNWVVRTKANKNQRRYSASTSPTLWALNRSFWHSKTSQTRKIAYASFRTGRNALKSFTRSGSRALSSCRKVEQQYTSTIFQTISNRSNSAVRLSFKRRKTKLSIWARWLCHTSFVRHSHLCWWFSRVFWLR